MVYCGHRRYLPLEHSFRRMKAAFDGSCEDRAPPCHPSIDEIEQYCIENESRSTRFKDNTARNVKGWKRLSIFFKLPYWKVRKAQRT